MENKKSKNIKSITRPFMELLLSKLEKISLKEKKDYTLLAVCPNSENVIISAIRAAKRANSPIMFAATLNQVDIDGGYTNWNQKDLVRIIKKESYRIGYQGPNIVCVDHGGPWLKDIQTLENWSLKESMQWVKKSFEASIMANYDLIHVDPTVDIYKKNISIDTVVNRTIELIIHTENFRKRNKKPPISYEVGTEEVHGGLANLDNLNKFLYLLKQGLKKNRIEYVWPIFIVAKVGTDLHTTQFNPQVAKKVSSIVKKHNSYIKGHYTDFVKNPHDYPKCGIGAANLGPEFTVAEYNAFSRLYEIEKKLYEKDRVAYLSHLMPVVKKSIIDSGRWKKWLIEGEKDFESLKESRKKWILGTCSRYVWAKPEVKCAQNQLYKNLEHNGIDAKSWIFLSIEKEIDKYFVAFNLVNINKKLNIEK